MMVNLMQLLWFYIAIMLIISDELHNRIFWNLFFDFYILFAGMLKVSLKSQLHMWLIHELIEATFHFIILSAVFLSFKIGFLAALIHLTLDLLHNLTIPHIKPLEHRTLHFVIESLFFILLFGL